jgi:all-trans-retinol dehydrogenase (NAD+)
MTEQIVLAYLRNSVPRLSYYKCDLTSPANIDETVAVILAKSTPTVLINNAGIASSHTILNTTDSWLEKLFRVNLLSHFQLIRLLLPPMMSQRKGHIVSLASMASYTGVANIGDYCATKAGVLGMHESLVSELGIRYKAMGGHCVQASIIHPLWARTPLVGSWADQMEKRGTPVLEASTVAKAVVRQVLQGRSGSVFVPEGKSS